MYHLPLEMTPHTAVLPGHPSPRVVQIAVLTFLTMSTFMQNLSRILFLANSQKDSRKHQCGPKNHGQGHSSVGAECGVAQKTAILYHKRHCTQMDRNSSFFMVFRWECDGSGWIQAYSAMGGGNLQCYISAFAQALLLDDAYSNVSSLICL